MRSHRHVRRLYQVAVTAIGVVLVLQRQVVAELIAEYSNESVGNVPPERMTVSGATEGIKARVYVRNIQVQRTGETTVINNISVEILYSK